MSSQKKTVMGACDYSIATLQQLKKDLMDLGAPHHEMTWAYAGMITPLVSYLLQICNETFVESAATGDASAKHDLEVIKLRFSGFIERMVHHE